MAMPERRGGVIRNLLGAAWAILRQRCPRCRVGRMFSRGVTMNDPCPVCGLLFQREEGYFLGAMYCSYVISSVILAAFYFTAAALLPGWNGMAVATVAVIPYLPLIPAVFRYSRVLWVHLERAGNPTDESAGAYEKVRLRQLADAKALPPVGPSAPGAGETFLHPGPPTR